MSCLTLPDSVITEPVMSTDTNNIDINLSYLSYNHESVGSSKWNGNLRVTKKGIYLNNDSIFLNKYVAKPKMPAAISIIKLDFDKSHLNKKITVDLSKITLVFDNDGTVFNSSPIASRGRGYRILTNFIDKPVKLLNNDSFYLYFYSPEGAIPTSVILYDGTEIIL